MATPDQIRFLRFVTKDLSGGCWTWTGSIGITGYGNFSYRNKTFLAHRAALLIFNKVKAFTPGLQVGHTCRSRRCVNPQHLDEKTASQNNGPDKLKHGTDQRGNKCHFAKLCWEEVDEIRSSNAPNTILANEFEVSPATISGIRNNRTWIK